MFVDTAEWWTLLRAMSAINVLAWLLAASMLYRASSADARAWSARRAQLWLSAGYVLGCAYRSLFPVYDVQRLVMVDSWLSSVLVGRSVATVAELCFAAQWALLLREAALAARCDAGVRIARAVLPLIALAEVCSWSSVLSTSNIGHVVEESLWGLSAALLVTGIVQVWPRSTPAQRPWLAFCGAGAALYVIYMFCVDVPMYWARWVADEAQGRVYLGLLQGLTDVSTRWVVSHRWSDWHSEVVWMTLYFSVAVWLSIALMHAPRPQTVVGGVEAEQLELPVEQRALSVQVADDEVSTLHVRRQMPAKPEPGNLLHSRLVTSTRPAGARPRL